MRYIAIILILSGCASGTASNPHDWSSFDKSAKEFDKSLEPDLCAEKQPSGSPSIKYTRINGVCIGSVN